MAEAKQNEPKKVVFKMETDGVEKEYDVNDWSDEAKQLYNKLAIIQKSNNDFVANANFEIEKSEILQKHYVEQIKVHLPTEETDDDKKESNSEEKGTPKTN